MGPALVVFLFVVGLIMAVYFALTKLPEILASRDLDRRLRDVTVSFADPQDDTTPTVVRQEKSGPLPALDNVLHVTPFGMPLKRLIERSGVQTTPSAMVLAGMCGGMLAALIASFVT